MRRRSAPPCRYCDRAGTLSPDISAHMANPARKIADCRRRAIRARQLMRQSSSTISAVQREANDRRRPSDARRRPPADRSEAAMALPLLRHARRSFRRRGGRARLRRQSGGTRSTWADKNDRLGASVLAIEAQERLDTRSPAISPSTNCSMPGAPPAAAAAANGADRRWQHGRDYTYAPDRHRQCCRMPQRSPRQHRNSSARRIASMRRKSRRSSARDDRPGYRWGVTRVDLIEAATCLRHGSLKRAPGQRTPSSPSIIQTC